MEKRFLVSFTLLILLGAYVSYTYQLSEITGSAVGSRVKGASPGRAQVYASSEEAINSAPERSMGSASAQRPIFPTPPPPMNAEIVRHIIKKITEKVDILEQQLTKKIILNDALKPLICSHLGWILHFTVVMTDLVFTYASDPVYANMYGQLLKLVGRIHHLLLIHCRDRDYTHNPGPQNVLDKYPKTYVDVITRLLNIRPPQSPPNSDETGLPQNKYVEAPPQAPVTQPCHPPLQIQGYDPKVHPYITFMPRCLSEYTDILVATACGALGIRLAPAAVSPFVAGANVVRNSNKAVAVAAYVNRLRQLQLAAAAPAITPEMINQAMGEMGTTPQQHQQFNQQNNPANQQSPAVDCDPPYTPGSTPITDGGLSPPPSTTSTAVTTTPACINNVDLSRIRLEIAQWGGYSNNGGFFSGPATEHYITAHINIYVPRDMASSLDDDLNNGFGGTIVSSSAAYYLYPGDEVDWEPKIYGVCGAVGIQGIHDCIFNGKLVIKSSQESGVKRLCNKGAIISIKFKTKCGAQEHPLYANFYIRCDPNSPNSPPAISPPIPSTAPPGTITSIPASPAPPQVSVAMLPPGTAGACSWDGNANECSGACPQGQYCTGSSTACQCQACPDNCKNGCIPPDCNDDNPNTMDACIPVPNSGCPAACPRQMECSHAPITRSR